MHFTCHLFDTSQGIFEGVQCGGFVIVFLLRRQMKFQLFQGFNHLLLGLGFGGFFTTVICTQSSHKHTQWQVRYGNTSFKKNDSLKARIKIMKSF